MEKTIEKPTTNGKAPVESSELPNSSKRALVEQKITQYQTAKFDAELEYKIAIRVGDDNAKKAQMERVKKLEQILEFLTIELAAHPEEG